VILFPTFQLIGRGLDPESLALFAFKSLIEIKDFFFVIGLNLFLRRMCLSMSLDQRDVERGFLDLRAYYYLIFIV
jgi:hypothetical protein